jgi:hypothetical protein
MLIFAPVLPMEAVGAEYDFGALFGAWGLMLAPLVTFGFAPDIFI